MGMKEANIKDILVGGGGGGVSYWAYTLLRGGQPAGELAQFDRATWLWVSLVLTIVVGAVAAFLMVFFVASTNTKDRMRAVGFAVACGLCWEPVLAGVSDRFTREYHDTQAERTIAQAEQLAPTPQASPPPAQAAEVAADLVKNASVVQNPILKAQVTDHAEKLLQTIERAPDAAVKTDALQ